eukprot:jgi/Ulvmu1/4604/UM002_0333.1
MGFFGLGGSKKDDAPKSVQRSMDSVAVAKKRMNKSKSQRDAEEAQWAADEAELAALEQAEATTTQNSTPTKVATYNPSASPNKPAVKSAMTKPPQPDA